MTQWPNNNTSYVTNLGGLLFYPPETIAEKSYMICPRPNSCVSAPCSRSVTAKSLLLTALCWRLNEHCFMRSEDMIHYKKHAELSLRESHHHQKDPWAGQAKQQWWWAVKLGRLLTLTSSILLSWTEALLLQLNYKLRAHATALLTSRATRATVISNQSPITSTLRKGDHTLNSLSEKWPYTPQLILLDHRSHLCFRKHSFWVLWPRQSPPRDGARRLNKHCFLRSEKMIHYQKHAHSVASVVSNSLWRRGLYPGSSVHGVLQARILEWAALPCSRDLPTQRSNLCLLHCRWILYHWTPEEAHTDLHGVWNKSSRLLPWEGWGPAAPGAGSHPGARASHPTELLIHELCHCSPTLPADFCTMLHN